MNMESEQKKVGEDAQKMDDILRRMLSTAPPKPAPKSVKKTAKKKTGR